MNRRQSTASNSPIRLSPSSSSGGLINGERKKPFIIGVGGGTASGKSTVCERIMEAVLSQPDMSSEKQIISLSQDSFYRELGDNDLKMAKKGLFNFDHPDAFDHDLMLACLKDIRDGKKTQVPVYDFVTNSRIKDKFTVIHPSDVVLVEGILVFYTSDIRDMLDMKLFVDTDADTRLARRVIRDIDERGRDLETILTQYTNLVKPAFEEFCLPTKKFADVIIPRGAENTVAIELVAQHILDIILAKKNDNATKQDSPFSRSRSNSDSMIR